MRCVKLVNCEKWISPEPGAGQAAFCTFPGKRQVQVLLSCSHSHMSGRTTFLCIGLQCTQYSCPALWRAALPATRERFLCVPRAGRGMPAPYAMLWSSIHLLGHTLYNLRSAGLWGCLTFRVEDQSGRTGGISGCLGLAVWLVLKTSAEDLVGWGKEVLLGVNNMQASSLAGSLRTHELAIILFKSMSPSECT